MMLWLPGTIPQMLGDRSEDTEGQVDPETLTVIVGTVPAVGQGRHMPPKLSIWEVLGANIQEQLILEQHMSPSGTQVRADTHSLGVKEE